VQAEDDAAFQDDAVEYDDAESVKQKSAGAWATTSTAMNEERQGMKDATR
jgi:hypothetical protein